MSVKTKGPIVGDLVKWEVDPLYCREEVTITTPSETAIDVEEALGLPVKSDGSGGYVPVAASDIANAAGLILETGPLVIEADGEAPKKRILLRAPAILNENFLPVTDYAGDAISAANFKAALAGKQFAFISEPSQTSVQTT